MSEPDDRGSWMAAGGKALLLNVPMSSKRFEDLAASAADAPRATIVDFGCGRGAFVHRLAELTSTAEIIGIDTSEDSIDHALARAVEADLSGQLTYSCVDASLWEGPVDTAVCFGASHVFGDTGSMFARLRKLGASRAIIGDGFWGQEPDEWCLTNLGEMARGLDAIAALATSAGWAIDGLDTSSLEEWDSFERQWTAGVRGFGTQGALSFADERTAEYQRYRGVLGFAWLQVSASD